MALFWMLELLPLAVTSVLPVAMAPMLGILSTDEVSMIYMKGSNMFFVGGKQIALPIDTATLKKQALYFPPARPNFDETIYIIQFCSFYC